MTGARGSGFASMASTEKEDSRRRGVRGVSGPAERRRSEGDRGAGEHPELGGWTTAPTVLGIVRPWPGHAQGEERERRVRTLQKEARIRPNCPRGLLNLAGLDRAGRAGLFFLQPRRGLWRSAEPPTLQSL